MKPAVKYEMNATPYIKISSPLELKLVPFSGHQAPNLFSKQEIADPKLSKNANLLKHSWLVKGAMHRK